MGRIRYKLPNGAMVIVRHLEAQGKRTQRELIHELALPIRTVRYSIRRLLERGIVRKYPNLKDMRSVFYVVDADVLRVIGDEQNEND